MLGTDKEIRQYLREHPHRRLKVGGSVFIIPQAGDPPDSAVHEFNRACGDLGRALQIVRDGYVSLKELRGAKRRAAQTKRVIAEILKYPDLRSHLKAYYSERRLQRERQRYFVSVN